MSAYIDKEKPVRFVLPEQQMESELDPNDMATKHQDLVNELAESIITYAAAGNEPAVIWWHAVFCFLGTMANETMKANSG